MNARPKKKRKYKKVKFKEVKFKLSEKQFRSLSNYSKARKTTIIKLIKKSIDRYINGFELEVPLRYYATEKQLDLFGDLPSHPNEQQVSEPD